MSKPIIQLKNTKVVYRPGKINETTAIKDVSLEIYEGEYVIFFGQSGSGKSTLLYIIAGLETAATGEINIDDLSLHELKGKDRINFYRNTIGMIFQAFYLVPHLTLKDNVMLSKMFFGVSKEEREKKADELIDRFQLSGVIDRKPVDLSGGQQQRVAIARSLMNNPKIILADEPTGNLDTKNAEIVQELLADINARENKTVIQVTHNPKDLRYADRVIYLKDGQIERISVNSEKAKARYKQSGGGTELDKLANRFPDLSRERLKAKLILRKILMDYDIDTEDYIENSVEKYIRGEMSKEQMVKFLDSDLGAGLYSQRAKSMSDEIEKLVEQVKQVDEADETATREKNHNEKVAEQIRMNLMKNHQELDMTWPQVFALDKAIVARLNNELSTADFFKTLDKSVEDEGVGLNRRTAKKFVEEMDLMLVDK